MKHICEVQPVPRESINTALKFSPQELNPPIVVRTPLRLLFTDRGSVWIKDETAQNTCAFKIRGVLHKLTTLETRPHFVVAASTGNHAICVAFAARKLALRAVVFVPASTPTKKIDAISGYGASVQQVQGDYESASEAARNFATANRAVLVHGFDDPQVIEGHISLFREIETDLGGAVDQFFVPVGGGGLLAAAIQANATSKARIVAVEFQGVQRLGKAITRSVLSSEEMPSVVPPSCEGLAIRTLGHCVVAAARKAPRLDLLNVSVKEMIEAAQLLWKNLHIRSELAGAAATAAALKVAQTSRLGTATAIVTGGNISDADFANILASRV